LYPVHSLKIMYNKLCVFHYRRKLRRTVQEMEATDFKQRINTIGGRCVK
jgi:hypothetical protein